MMKIFPVFRVLVDLSPFLVCFKERGEKEHSRETTPLIQH